jgi:hypothetical protein
MRLLPAIAVGALLLSGLSACSGDARADRHPDDDADHVVAGGTVHDLGGGGLFAVTGGSDVLRIRAADLGGAAYRLSTPDDAHVRPTAHLDGGTVYAGVADDPDNSGPALVTAELSKAVTWRLRLDGGAKQELLDLSGAQVTRVDLTAGSSVVEATLPAPHGTTVLTLAGGAAQLTIHLAPQAPVRVRAGGGAGSVSIDGVRRTGVAGGSDFTPTGWATATDRYDIDLSAGVSALTVDRTPS